MANEKIKQNYKNIANAIRAKTGENGVMTAEEMPAKIESIETGIEPTGSISITSNGNNIDVAQYAKADVNVPSFPEPTGNKYIYQNGYGIDVKNYATVGVDVPSPTADFDNQNPLHKNCANISYGDFEDNDLQLNIDVGAIYGLLDFTVYEIDAETGEIADASLTPTSQSGIDWDNIRTYGLYLPIILPEAEEGSQEVEINLDCHNFVTYSERGPDEETEITDEMVSNYLNANYQVEVYIKDALGNTIGTVDITENMNRQS